MRKSYVFIPQKAVRVLRNPLLRTKRKVAVVKSVMMYGEPKEVIRKSEVKESDVLRGTVTALVSYNDG